MRNLEAGLEYAPERSEGASWDIIRCHAEFQAERTVEMRRPGGSEGPHRSLVMVLRMVGFGSRLRDILGLARRGQKLVLVGDEEGRELSSEVLQAMASHSRVWQLVFSFHSVQLF